MMGIWALKNWNGLGELINKTLVEDVYLIIEGRRRRTFSCSSTKKQAERVFKEIIQSYRNGDKEYEIPKDENEIIIIF